MDSPRPGGPPAYEPMTHHDAVASMAPERYLLDEMTGVERERFEAHFFECAECADDLRISESLRQELRAAGAPVPSPPRTGRADHAATVVAMPRRWRPGLVLPWAAAASLALVAGYQSFVALPTLRERTGPQPLSPIVLRGATRGADVRVPIAPGQSFVTLAADITAQPAADQVQFDLRDEDGNTVTSGLAPTPSPGTALLLLVPADRFGAQGAHTLIVRDASRPQDVLGEFRFIVTQ